MHMVDPLAGQVGKSRKVLVCSKPLRLKAARRSCTAHDGFAANDPAHSRKPRQNSARYPVNAGDFRADAAFAMPEVYEFLEAERIKYAMATGQPGSAEQNRLSAHAPQSDDLRTMCGGSMPISAIRPEPGPSRGGLSPRSSGIPENFIPASTSS